MWNIKRGHKHTISFVGKTALPAGYQLFRANQFDVEEAKEAEAVKAG